MCLRGQVSELLSWQVTRISKPQGKLQTDCSTYFLGHAPSSVSSRQSSASWIYVKHPCNYVTLLSAVYLACFWLHMTSKCQLSLTKKKLLALINPQSSVLEQAADCAALRPKHGHGCCGKLPQTCWVTLQSPFQAMATPAFSNFRFNANFTKQYNFFFQLTVWNGAV